MALPEAALSRVNRRWRGLRPVFWGTALSQCGPVKPPGHRQRRSCASHMPPPQSPHSSVCAPPLVSSAGTVRSHRRRRCIYALSGGADSDERAAPQRSALRQRRGSDAWLEGVEAHTWLEGVEAHTAACVRVAAVLARVADGGHGRVVCGCGYLATTVDVQCVTNNAEFAAAPCVRGSTHAHEWASTPPFRQRAEVLAALALGLSGSRSNLHPYFMHKCLCGNDAADESAGCVTFH